MKHRLEIHAAEDPNFLDELSDVLDIRNWNPSAFDPKVDGNKKDKLMTKEMNTMLENLENPLKMHPTKITKDMLTYPLKDAPKGHRKGYVNISFEKCIQQTSRRIC